jgi:DNA-binding CsgD family transcriptional regulator
MDASLPNENPAAALLRSAGVRDWIFGVFNELGGLTDFSQSASSLDTRRALQLLFASPVNVPVGSEPSAISFAAPPDLPLHVMTVTGKAPSGQILRLVALRSLPSSGFGAAEAGSARGALSAIADTLRRAPAAGDGDPRMARLREAPEIFVLNRDYCIESRGGGDHRTQLGTLLAPVDERLPSFIELPIRTATADWDFDSIAACSFQSFNAYPALVVRLVPTQGHARVLITVIVERMQPRAIKTAIRRFKLSPREREIALLLLRGFSAQEVAEALCIATSTAQDHVKRLIAKTGARNRVEMAARLLGWQRPRRAHGDQESDEGGALAEPAVDGHARRPTQMV